MKDFKPGEFHDPELQKQMDKIVDEMVRRHNLAIENLTRDQVTSVVKQLFASGDIVILVSHNSNAQTASYLPYRRVQELENEIERLQKIIEERDDRDLGESIERDLSE